MKYLLAPWRWAFISKSEKNEGCLFCRAQGQSDAEALIVNRGRNFFTMLNKYPYTSGHLMIVPNRHLGQPGQLSAADAVEMWQALQDALAVLEEAYHPQGFNVGMNLGQAAGAGVKDHFHLHLVPRWSGDANFMAIVGDVRVASYDLAEIYRVVRAGLAKRRPAD